MKRKHLTVFPCVLENVWSSLVFPPACPFLRKDWATCCNYLLSLFTCTLFPCFIRKPLKVCLLSIYRDFLLHTTSQHLLLLVGIDTPIYQKYYDTPSILVGHHACHSARGGSRHVCR